MFSYWYVLLICDFVGAVLWVDMSIKFPRHKKIKLIVGLFDLAAVFYCAYKIISHS